MLFVGSEAKYDVETDISFYYQVTTDVPSAASTPAVSTDARASTTKSCWTARVRCTTSQTFAELFLTNLRNATETASTRVLSLSGGSHAGAAVAMVDANYSIIGDDALSEHVYENVYFNEEDNVFVTEFLNNVRAEIAWKRLEGGG
ncbi:hypothetical protein CYMTET_37607 [Cymbomonas tetramitiformis]|uniref:Uncharacterized protein n=1 Tax=Cymbomonas tetramitiformis TaxID=36881 RepID=A0AAE0CF72_9CHLO|nr:hypothetical protein CYMTET_37607 [Cymbomonas tetramitiformis]